MQRMLRYVALLCAGGLILAGCAGQRSAVSALGAQAPQPVELHVYMHGADGSVTSSVAQANPASSGALEVELSRFDQPYQQPSYQQPSYQQSAYNESLPIAPYVPALVVDAQGETRSAVGTFKGSEPNERVSFTAEEADHIKNVWIAPRQGEMLIVPLTPLQLQFRFPLKAGQLLSPYGWRGNAMHTGSDLKAYPGDTVFAALDGIVRMSKAYGAYGNIVVVRHPNGIETLYGHNARNLVAVNDRVHAGQPIAMAGRTGRASTEHVHFEVRVAGRALDPALMVDLHGRMLREDTLYIYNQGDVVMALKAETAPAYFTNLKTGIPAPIAAAGRAYMTMGRGHVYADPQRSYYPSQQTGSLPAQQQSYYPEPAPSYEGYYLVPAPSESYGGQPATQTQQRLDYAPTGGEYHVMRPKETLFALTRQYGITIHELLSLNPQITDPNRVMIGERVRIRR